MTYVTTIPVQSQPDANGLTARGRLSSGADTLWRRADTMKNLCQRAGRAGVTASMNAAAGSYFRRELLNRPHGWAAGELQARGLGFVLTADSRWRTGYAPDGWSCLVDHLRSLGFDDRAMIRAGLAVSTSEGYVVDRFRDQIIFVAGAADGGASGFVGHGRRRSLFGETSESPIAGAHPALVGISEQEPELAAGAVPVIVRWPADALAVYQADQRESKWAGIALCGTTLSLPQAGLLRTHSASGTVIVALGGGRVARNAAVGLLTTLSVTFGRVLVADLREEDEPSSIGGAGGRPFRLRAELDATRPLASLAIELELMSRRRRLHRLEERVAAVHAIAPLISRLPSGLIAPEVQRLSDLLDLHPTRVSRELLAAFGSSTPHAIPGD